VCGDCRRDFVPHVRRCTHCALALDAYAPAPHRCSVPAPSWDACRAAVDYAFPWDHLVRRYKYAHEAALAAPLAALMVDAAEGLDLAAAPLVVPVPPSLARLRQRGFDPAWELTRRVARALGLVAAPGALVRRHDRAQAGAARQDRLANMRSAIALAPGARQRLRGQRVLLVDDVLTTGATLEVAAGRLREAGAMRVEALVLARTPPPSPPPSGDATAGPR
jgi:ComF family protein